MGSVIVTEQGLPGEIAPQTVSAFLSRTLASIPRADQRRWGDVYVRGLLSVDGKKTMRALAGKGRGNAEQSLYQFISKSPWDSMAVRGELARLFQEQARPRAWVVRPLVITKAGRHSVGVERQFVSQYGRVVNCQRAMGIWLASDAMSCPVDWRLALPGCWTDEPGRREQAAIPDGVSTCPPEQCAIGSLADMSAAWGLDSRPVVMDLRESDPYPVCAALTRRHIPFVVRVRAEAAYTSWAPSPSPSPAPYRGTRPGLVGALSAHRMPVEWLDHTTGTLRATYVGATRVVLRDRHVRTDSGELLLLGAWTTAGRPEPDEFWLTRMPRSQLGAAYRTAMLSRRVGRDLAEVAEPLGLRDFEGRSFRGWHHHMTMVSLAHALRVLTTPRPTRDVTAPHPARDLPAQQSARDLTPPRRARGLTAQQSARDLTAQPPRTTTTTTQASAA
ncbi:IS701 family transposase [Streptomyces sp. NPDC048416]|uniref:IS701 family transposase n=1 Tax=Streptomyces sp. NPDC048416 TaxID=3365546 RepID=UPI00370FB638